MPTSSSWTSNLIEEFHSTPTGGHGGALRTYKRIAASFYWRGMMKQVCKYVADCLVCQRNKYEYLSPTGLLQPLPTPKHVCEDLNMDFISSLPRSKGVYCLLVVVDRLSKYAHFLCLRHPFTARVVAELFAREII